MQGVYILFSGGYDSSYMVEKVLSNINGYENKEKYEVNLVSIEGTFSGKKTQREIEARNKLLNYWKAKYYNIKINHYIIKVDITKFSLNTMKKPGLSQPLIWLPALLMSLDFSLYDNIMLIFTYICGDQALSFTENIKNIVYNTIDIACIDHVNAFKIDDFGNNKNCKDKLNICFPLRAVYKEDIIVQLIKTDPFIFDNCTTCENPEEKDFCNECTPCKVLKSVFLNIISDRSIEESVKDIIKNKLSLFEDHINGEPVKKEKVVLSD